MFQVAALVAIAETLFYLAVLITLAVRAGPGAPIGILLIYLGPAWLVATLRIALGLKLANGLSASSPKGWLLDATIMGVVLAFLQMFGMTFLHDSSMLYRAIPFLIAFHVIAAVAFQHVRRKSNPW